MIILGSIPGLENIKWIADKSTWKQKFIELKGKKQNLIQCSFRSFWGRNLLAINNPHLHHEWRPNQLPVTCSDDALL